MPSTRYKIIALGPQVQPATATAPFHVNLAGIAKKNSPPAQPNIVPNELVCNLIARALFLPCPPGALMQKDADTFFFSLDFNLAGQTLPPINPPNFVRTFQRLSWGIISFDALVMNHDRHPGNISHDSATNNVQIFDHSHAFLAQTTDIEAHLAAKESQLAIGGHCLASVVESDDGQLEWISKIGSLPNFMIEGAIDGGCTCGIPQNNKTILIDFLKRRRDKLGDLFAEHRAVFPKLPRI